jgi:hypothetical protein
MTYWKFLRAGRTGVFTGFAWPAPGRWVHSSPPAPCVNGVHACRATDLPYWLAEELWTIELAGTVVTGEHKVTATSGRLLAQVETWPGLVHQLSRACLERTVHHACQDLRAAGLSEAADELFGHLDRPDQLGAVAGRCAQIATQSGRRRIATMCGYVEDAVEGLTAYPVASLAYIAARAAQHSRTACAVDPYTAEREWQAQWLHDRLEAGLGS